MTDPTTKTDLLEEPAEAAEAAPESATADAPAETVKTSRGSRFRLRRRGRKDAPPAADQASDEPVATPAAAEPAADGADPATAAPSADGAGGASVTDRRKLTGGGSLRKLTSVLAVIALLLGALLLVELIRGPGNGPKLERAQNRREAARQAADVAVPKLFSFDYHKLDADLATQRAQTTGAFTNEVDQVTGPALRPIAAKEHVVVQAVSLGSAVIDDSGPDVKVLVFLNQAVTLDLLPAPRLDRNRVIATMHQVGNDWKVAGIQAL